MEIKLPSFLTSELVEVSIQLQALATFTVGKEGTVPSAQKAG
jgi:hypothetical protein